METSNTIKSDANLSLWNRKILNLSGIEDVISFDEDSVNLETEMGEMMIDGENLHVGTLDTQKGVVVIDGRINGLYYRTEQPRKKGIGRIFSR